MGGGVGGGGQCAAVKQGNGVKQLLPPDTSVTFQEREQKQNHNTLTHYMSRMPMGLYALVDKL